MNDTFPHDTSGCAASANTVRGCSGSTVGPSGSHHIIGPLQKASGPRKKEKTTMSHFWDTHHKSVSTNAAKSQSQTSRVPNVWPCHWLSKRRSKTKQVTSQSWAPLDAHYGWASFVADRPSMNARQRISVDGRSPHHCLHATGHAFHWRRM